MKKDEKVFNDENLPVIKNNLPNILRDLKWSQKDLAKASKISENTISDILNQEISPNAKTMIKICVAVSLNIGEVFFIPNLEKKTLINLIAS